MSERPDAQTPLSPSLEGVATTSHANSIALLTGQLDLTPPQPRRIFVNRTLRFDRIDWIGFDMDYTLLRYRNEQMGPLLYHKACEKLLEAGSPAPLHTWRYDPQRAMRGILIDKQTGNLLQMNRHRHVKTGYLGHQPLDKAARRRYRVDPLQLSESQGGDRFRLIDTLFGVPEACLFADLVAWHLKREKAENIDFPKLYNEVRTAMDRAHADGTIHRAIAADFPRYILPDPALATTLQRFRMWGKKLFLLTNSDWDYTDEALGFLLNAQREDMPSWKDYFDRIIVRAAKPSFFTESRPFERLNADGTSCGTSETLGDARFARGGNQRALQQALDVPGDHVLYVGDHIYGDILRTKKSSTWRTMLIIEELEQEIEQFQAQAESRQQWEKLTQRRDLLDTALHQHTLLQEKLEQWAAETSPGSMRVTLEEQLLNSALKQTTLRIEQIKRELEDVVHKADALYAQIQEGCNPYWGMLFREGYEASYLAEQVRKFACIYSSRVTNFLFYMPTQYFRPPPPRLPHEIERLP